MKASELVDQMSDLKEFLEAFKTLKTEIEERYSELKRVEKNILNFVNGMEQEVKRVTHLVEACMIKTNAFTRKNTTFNKSHYFTEAEVREMFAVSPRHLPKLRELGLGPVYTIHNKKIYYDAVSVSLWMANDGDWRIKLEEQRKARRKSRKKATKKES